MRLKEQRKGKKRDNFKKRSLRKEDDKAGTEVSSFLPSPFWSWLCGPHRAHPWEPGEGSLHHPVPGRNCSSSSNSGVAVLMLQSVICGFYGDVLEIGNKVAPVSSPAGR